jgi:hypothetical protein
MYAFLAVVAVMMLLQVETTLPGWQVVVGFVGGALGRIFIPYTLEWVKSKSKFDWRYIIGQVLAVVISLVPVVLVDSWMASLAAMSVIASISLGWFSADLGREGQKVADIYRDWKNGR